MHSRTSYVYFRRSTVNLRLLTIELLPWYHNLRSAIYKMALSGQKKRVQSEVKLHGMTWIHASSLQPFQAWFITSSSTSAAFIDCTCTVHDGDGFVFFWGRNTLTTGINAPFFAKSSRAVVRARCEHAAAVRRQSCCRALAFSPLIDFSFGGAL